MIISNPPFHPLKGIIAVVLAWFIAQATKVITDYFRNKKLNVKSFLDTGGMPSSHSASVASLSTVVGLYYGFISIPFLIAGVFTIITLFDAAGVRRSVGKQSQLLNQMIEDLAEHHEITNDRVKELLGHTPIQVFAGAFLGIAIAVIICG
jgi:acid phosphatase family membrane protein YuiD